MTDATNLGDIIVTGQKRSNSSQSFPALPQTVFVPPPYATPEAVKDDTWREVPPCSIPAFRRRWNQDAAAASATSAFLSYALGLASLNEGDVTPYGPTLTRREFGADLIMGPNGTVVLGQISHGPLPQPGQSAGVTIQHGNLQLANWMGDIHNHPGGNPLPSPTDWAGFQSMLQQLRNAGLPTNNRFMYTIVADASSPTGYRTYAWGENDNPDLPGMEVNPQAGNCPS